MIDPDRRELLVSEIAEAINRHSIENDSNTPDFILAEVAVAAIESFDAATRTRDHWYGYPSEADLATTTARTLDPKEAELEG